MSLEEQRLHFRESMPKGMAFYEWIFSKDETKERYTSDIYQTDQEFKSADTYDIIPELLEVLYKVATCGYGCNKGSHVIEYITGRGYNLAIASLKLLRIGFYDESLSLIRSISEIVNLFALFGLDQNALVEWYDQSTKDRMRNFTPKKVRDRIKTFQLAPPVSDEYYWKMCEFGVHVNPKTMPQGHNLMERALVGGFVIRELAISVLNDLANNIHWLCIMALRNTVDKETFIFETDRLNALDKKIGDLGIQTLERYLNSKRT